MPSYRQTETCLPNDFRRKISPRNRKNPRLGNSPLGKSRPENSPPPLERSSRENLPPKKFSPGKFPSGKFFPGDLFSFHYKSNELKYEKNALFLAICSLLQTLEQIGLYRSKRSCLRYNPGAAGLRSPYSPVE